MEYHAVQCITRRSRALLRGLGNERRLAILLYLVAGERSVGELQRLLPLGQSALSQHLARLRHAGLVTARREAQSVFYSLASREAVAAINLLARLYGTDDTTPVSRTIGFDSP